MAGITVPLAVVAPATTGLADTTWTGTTSSDWFTGSNWDDGVPTDTGTVTIDTASPNATVVSDQATNGTATGNVVEVTGSGWLTIEDAGYLSTVDLGIGLNGGDDAKVIVSGNGSTLEVTGGNLVLGDLDGGSGVGTLILSAGGKFVADGGINIENDDSKLVIGGLTTAVAPGTLSLPNEDFGSIFAFGGEILFNHTASEADGYQFAPIITNGPVRINVMSGHTTLTGDNSEMTGTITVDGGTLEVANAFSGTTLVVGDSAVGSGFVIGNGGEAVITGNVTVGQESGSSGEVLFSGGDSDDPSTLSVGGNFIVGKKGSGVLVLSENSEAIVNDGSGTITVADSSGSTGMVVFGAEDGADAAAAGTLSATSLTFGDGTGSLVFNHTASSADPFAFAIPVSGKGTIEVLSGYTELSGDNGAFSGAVTVDGGTLTLSGDLDGNALTVGDENTDAELVVENYTTTKISGATIVGNQAGSSGTVVVSGATDNGSLQQSKLSTKSLTVGGSGSGVLVVNNDALVNVNSGDSSLLIASEAGSTGTFAIGAASGETALGTGTLKAKSIAFGNGDGTLLFNHADDTGTFAFDHTISGAGTIVSENGHTSLQGKLAGFTGTTEVEGGFLSVDTELPGDVIVSGGTLLGIGTLTGSATIQDGGTLAPGNSVGTLKSADVTFETGSVFAIEIDDDGKADQLESSGTVKINGGTVDVTADAYYVDETVTILTGDKISGKFDTVTGATAFIDYTLDYETNNGDDVVELTQVVSQSFSSIAPTPNTKALASGLDSLVDTNVTHEVVQVLLGSESEAAALEAFDQLTGEGHPSLKGILVENSQQAVQRIHDRFRTAFGEGRQGTVVMSYAGGGQDLTRDGWGVGFWIAPYGGRLDTDGSKNTAAVDSDFGGVLAGLDGWVSDTVRLGMVGGYGNTTASIDDRAFDGTVIGGTAGAYGGYEMGAAVLNAGALYSWHAIETKRRLTAPVDQTLKADYDAQSWQLFAEASYAVETPWATITPFGGVSYVNLRTDAFDERGGSAALSAKSADMDTTFTTLGLRSSIPLGKVVRAHGLAGWRHAYGDVDPTMVFTLDASDPFTIMGAPIAEDVFIIEAGFDVAVSDSLTGGLSYQGQIGDGVEAHGGLARLAARF